MMGTAHSVLGLRRTLALLGKCTDSRKQSGTAPGGRVASAKCPKIIFQTVVALSLFLCSASLAQALEVIPVPWEPLDPSIPHQAYNGHPTTFKAIARGGDGA